MKKALLILFVPATISLSAQLLPQQKIASGYSAASSRHKGKVVLLDTYFNNEWKKDAKGQKVRYHYTWNDTNNSGFSLLGDVFGAQGIQTRYLETAPTAKKLKKADIYILVDPDTEKETEKPNYMNAASARVIADWVHGGGVLVLMGNDAENAGLKNFNILSSQFGIRFNEDNFNQVINNQYEQGAVAIPEGHPVFKTAKKIFIKELSTLQVTAPATTILTKEGKNIMAMARYGKGTVFAIGDPWLYNEYVNGKKLPSDFDNYKAAEDLVKWLLLQTAKAKS